MKRDIFGLICAATESVKNQKADLCYWYNYRLAPLHIFLQKTLVEILSLIIET